MVDIQQDFLGSSNLELKVKKVCRHTDNQNRDIDMALARVGFPRGYSMFTRFLWIKFCDKINNYPPELRNEPIKEMECSADEIVAVIPIFKRQIGQGKVIHYGHPATRVV